MFKKLFTKKGSAEIVSIILGTVVIGGLALAVTEGLSTSTKASLEAGLNKQNEKIELIYENAFGDIDVEAPNLGGSD